MNSMKENEQLTFDGIEIQEIEEEYDDFPERWTETVNRIRKYAGKETFEIPDKKRWASVR